MKYLLILLVLFAGCVGSDEMVIKKKHFDILNKNVRDLIREEESLLLKKESFTPAEFSKYLMASNRNNGILAVIGSWKKYSGKKLDGFIKMHRRSKEVDEHIYKLMSEFYKKKGKK